MELMSRKSARQYLEETVTAYYDSDVIRVIEELRLIKRLEKLNV